MVTGIVWQQPKKEFLVKNRIAWLAVALLLVPLASWAQEGDPAEAAAPEGEGQASELFETEAENLSYIIGADVARSTKENGIDLDFEIFTQGFMDSRAGTVKMTPEEMKNIMMSFAQERRAQMQAEKAKEAAGNLQAAETFLAENKTKEGVQELESGVQYIVIEEGTGEVPQLGATVEVHYTGTLPDGTKFDSSHDRGEPFRTKTNGRIIPGWQDVLQHMPVGSKWKVFIPPALAYGEQGNRSIPPNQMLIFEMEMLRIVPPEELAQPEQPQEPKLITPGGAS